MGLFQVGVGTPQLAQGSAGDDQAGEASQVIVARRAVDRDGRAVAVWRAQLDLAVSDNITADVLREVFDHRDILGHEQRGEGLADDVVRRHADQCLECAIDLRNLSLGVGDDQDVGHR